LRDKTLALLDKYKLVPETFFPNSTMHEAAAAEKSVNDALELARLLKPHGTRVIIVNPIPKPNNAPKTDEELNTQARYVAQLGDELYKLGMKLALHHHTPELINNQREWRHFMQHTNPNRVYCCVDVHWAYRGGQDVMTFLHAAGDRLLVGYLVVELAYETGSEATRSLTEDLRLSRLYTEKTFGLPA
jgi:sugar phosphate isomerase/epimerase